VGFNPATLIPAPRFNIQAASDALFGAAVALIDFYGAVTLPTRQGSVPGSEPAWDGEQFTINHLNMSVGMPGVEPNQAVLPIQLLFFYNFELLLLRKVETVTGKGKQGGIPSALKLDADAQTIEQDSVAMLQAVVTMHLNGLIVPVEIPFKYAAPTSLTPQGGLSGNRMAISFQAGMSPQPGDY
jgi:hypothetical protein